MDSEQKVVSAIGCLLVAFWLSGIAFLIWVIVTIVDWLVTK